MAKARSLVGLDVHAGIDNAEISKRSTPNGRP
jgi:hypothetical protein